MTGISMLISALMTGTSHEPCNMACDSCLIIAVQNEAYLKARLVRELVKV